MLRLSLVKKTRARLGESHHSQLDLRHMPAHAAILWQGLMCLNVSQIAPKKIFEDTRPPLSQSIRV